MISSDIKVEKVNTKNYLNKTVLDPDPINAHEDENW